MQEYRAKAIYITNKIVVFEQKYRKFITVIAWVIK